MREYKWEVHPPYYAVLYGPEPYLIAAVLTVKWEDEDQIYGEWITISERYKTAGAVTDDISVPLEQIMKRVEINLCNDLKEQITELEEDLCNARSLALGKEGDDPYEWAELE